MRAIEIEWKGEFYKISEEEAFKIGEIVEEILTLPELGEMGGKPKFFKVSRCYSEMLNFCGVKVSPQEVHSEMMSQMKKGNDADNIQMVFASACTVLIEILMDGAPQEEDEIVEAPKKKKRNSASRALSQR